MSLQNFFCCCSGAAGPGKGEASDEDDDNEFFDAMEEAPEFITVPADPQFHKSVCFHSHHTHHHVIRGKKLPNNTLNTLFIYLN